MATLTALFPNCDLKTDAGFRDLVTHIQDLMDDVDPLVLAKSADTGQINPLTVTTPHNSSSSVVKYGGYNIYVLQDAQQDIYIKLHYGVFGRLNSIHLGEYCIKFELGTGSDGSGNLTGVFMTSTMRALPDSDEASGLTTRGTHTSYITVKDGFFALCLEVGANISGDFAAYPNSTLSTESHTLIISRQGATKCFLIVTGSYYENELAAQGLQAFKTRKRDLTTFVVDLETDGSGYIQDAKTNAFCGFIPGTSAAIGADIGVLRVPVVSHTTIYEDPNLLLYFGGDLSNAAQMTITLDSVSSNFLFLTPSLRTMFPYMNLAIRWE